MAPVISDEVFRAYLDCRTKAHFISIRSAVPHNEISEWKLRLATDYRAECSARLAALLEDRLCYRGTPSSSDLRAHTYKLILNCTIGNDTLQSHMDALELATSPDRLTQRIYLPIRALAHEVVTRADRLLLAFDALALATICGEPPVRGKIIHGISQRALTVNLSSLIPTVRRYLSEIFSYLTQAPRHELNRHCAACDFQSVCRQIATEKDDLSLLANMTELERKKQNRKGIFTVTQLSYTFRPRRRPAKQASTRPLYSHSLKALAIRENKIYVTACPNLETTAGPVVYLDVEGLPDKQFYYLVGLRVCDGNSTTQHSFWADSPCDERQMWAACLSTLASIEGARIFCYGQFDLTFLRRMGTRYSDLLGAPNLVDELLKNSTNVLTKIYGHVYFPVYSNSLKDIGSFLNVHWTHPGSSGLYALMWRSHWESSRDTALKDRLIAYNTDDCKALEVVVDAIAQLSSCQMHGDEAASSARTNNVVQVDSLKREYPQRYRRTQFAIPEFNHINNCAYWDYQRTKIYVRTNQPVGKAVRREVRHKAVTALRINAHIDCDKRPDTCPKCSATAGLDKHARLARVVYDLRFTNTGVKRRVIRYTWSRYRCVTCDFAFQVHWAREKYGPNLRAFLLYYAIELHVPLNAFNGCIRQLVGLQLGTGAATMMKRSGARYYESLYAELFRRVTHGRMVHVDETKVSIRGREAFVWVFSNLEEVVYVYSASREGTILRDALNEFKGVLISDFYAAYNSISCRQQKCLIHLIRDLNDALLKEPFNEELRIMMSDFGRLLTEVIDSVDRFGLKSYHLKKYKPSVAKFYQGLATSNLRSDTAIKWRKRFEKNRDTLFTFLDYDGVPWNNNNAEHAVKRFAFLRGIIGGGSSEKGIRDYLILLSVCETCRLKGIPFFDFLRTGETTFERFLAAKPR